jgi:hypothetical protein
MKHSSSVPRSAQYHNSPEDQGPRVSQDALALLGSLGRYSKVKENAEAIKAGRFPVDIDAPAAGIYWYFAGQVLPGVTSSAEDRNQIAQKIAETFAKSNVPVEDCTSDPDRHWDLVHPWTNR